MSEDDTLLQPGAAILDLRLPADFLIAHLPGAVNIPLEELENRIYELPAPHEPLLVFDAAADRARRAVEILALGNRTTRVIRARSSDLCESGPSANKLWKPHALLVEAVDICRQEWGTLRDRTALDIACGCGRDAVFLAEQGFRAHAWDILPDALAQCAALAERNNVQVMTRCIDLESDTCLSIAPGGAHGLRSAEQIKNSFDLVSCFYFLDRSLFPVIRPMVRPGGMLVYETFVDPQRERFGKPQRARFVLRQNELSAAFADWHILTYREQLSAPRKMAASLIARRPGQQKGT